MLSFDEMKLLSLYREAYREDKIDAVNILLNSHTYDDFINQNGEFNLPNNEVRKRVERKQITWCI